MSKRPGSIASVVILFSAFLITGSASAAASTGPVIIPMLHQDVSPALSSLRPQPDKHNHYTKRHREVPGHKHQGNAPVSGTGTSSATIPGTTTNFDGIGNGVYGYSVNSAPPDPNGTVGPNHYFEIVNTAFAIFDKSGALKYGPAASNTIWSGFGGNCEAKNDGDATVLYDQAADRWLVAQLMVSATPYLMCLAVSTSPDPTGSYYRYSYNYGSDFPDYPKLGIWPDAYYMTTNLFANGSTFEGAGVAALNRTAILNGNANDQQLFRTSSAYGGLLPASLDGSSPPPSGTPNFLVGLGTDGQSLAYWTFQVDWSNSANSAFTGPSSIAVQPYAEACNGGTCIPQAGTSTQLDSLADRVMYRLAYRNFGDHQSLVVDHSVTIGSTVGVQWYELRVGASNTLGLYQQGDWSPDTTYRWMGSIAMDKSGDIALGYSTSSSSQHPGIAYTGRTASDPAGTMENEVTVLIGGGSQTGDFFNGPLHRWGDYTSMAVDPADGCTFWYTNEYIPSNGDFNWRTRVASFKFSNCGAAPANNFTMSAAEATPGSGTVAQGSTAQYTVSTTVTTGSSSQSVSLSASGLPAGSTATFNPQTISSGQSSALSITTSNPTTPPGNYTVTITGTGTDATNTTTVQLVVNNAGDNFSMSASPNNLTLNQGSQGTSTISTTMTSGAPETINLSASVSPTGPTATLNPTNVTTGGSSTLTVSVNNAVAVGSYNVTVTGTGQTGNQTQTATVSVTVKAAPPNAIVNGGFENGNFSGWTTSGTTAVVTTPVHSGSYAARLGTTTPTNGDSSIAQTFTAPSSGGTLSFWYYVVCPDSVRYDWATAKLRDNTTGTTRTVLSKTCVGNSGWTKVTASLTAGHSYTITLISHDDNWPGDPTYTFYDDVSVG